MEKAFAKRFDFDCVRISQVRTVSQIQSNGKCPLGWLYINVYKSFIVGRWRCSFQTNRAMREPLHSGASDQHRLHVFHVYVRT